MARPGRKPKIPSAEQLEVLFSMLADKATLQSIAKALGVCRATVRKWAWKYAPTQSS